MIGQSIELQIILGFNCNFACGHCLNSSRPNFTSFDITDSEINFVYENLADFSLVQEISAEEGISIVPTRLIRSGRSKKCEEVENSFSSGPNCPNLQDHRVKVSYIPRRGLTLCCGPLLFDYNLDNAGFFTNEINQIFDSVRYRAFRPEFAEYQVLKQIYATGDACESCTKTFEKIQSGDLSKNQIDKLNRKFLETRNYLTDFFEKSLSKHFHVKYLIRLNPEDYQQRRVGSEISTLTITHLKSLSPKQLDEFREFTIRSFYTPYANEYDEKDIGEFVSVMPIYFNGGSETHTFFFHKEDELVAVLTLYRYESHPYFKDETYHIGYWGYDKSRLTVDEARFVKSSWNNILGTVAIEKNIPVVGLIDYFNSSVRKMASEFGFSLKAMRLDKRP